jgi:PIN domain nuclease of toxin-antitoxin system
VGSDEVILLDTHAAIWLAKDEAALGKGSRSMALDARNEGRLAISAVSFWEIALLSEKKRIDLHGSPEELRSDLLSTGIVELPLTGGIAILSVQLGRLHGDPADRFIAATAIAHDATLITADKRLLKWRHKMKRQNAGR